MAVSSPFRSLALIAGQRVGTREQRAFYGQRARSVASQDEPNLPSAFCVLCPPMNFSRAHSYLPADDGISLPVILNNGAEKLLAHVDTGASHCLFERRHGELLNLDVEAGDPMAFPTATGSIEAFGHLVAIETLGLNFE